MSLINDALKKAQKQRNTESAPLSAIPGIGGEPAARIAKRAKPAGFNFLIFVGLGAGTVLALGIGGFFLFRGMTAKPEAPSPKKPALVAQAAPVTPAPAAPAPVLVVPGEATPDTTYVLPAAPEPTPLAAPIIAVESKPVVVAPVAPPPEPEIPKLVIPPPKLPPKVIAYIEGLHVAGIRVSTTDSKALINDRVYRLGDTVEHQLGLKITGITGTSLIFEDESGARYTRNF